MILIILTSVSSELTKLKLDYHTRVIYTIEEVLALWMSLFLLFLILRFTRETQVSQMHDKILGKKVPSIVFIRNQALLKDAIKD